MKNVLLYEIDELLLQFLNNCDNQSYKNNYSINAMKFKWCIDQGGMWVGSIKDDRLVSISGIHPFKDGWRALFRGVQLESRSIGLNKYHMQSYPFHSHLPFQIKWAEMNNNDPIYITTSVKEDMSGKMTRINKTFNHLEKTKIIEYIDTQDVYNVEQNIWKLNKKLYSEIRKKY